MSASDSIALAHTSYPARVFAPVSVSCVAHAALAPTWLPCKQGVRRRAQGAACAPAKKKSMASRPCALRTRMSCGSRPVVKLSERWRIQHMRPMRKALAMCTWVQMRDRKRPAQHATRLEELVPASCSQEQALAWRKAWQSGPLLASDAGAVKILLHRGACSQ